MAYQRPFLISLKRGDQQLPWGFRTFGGREYGQPHVVEKVAQDSIAEMCGLHVGDEVIQVGRINVQEMSFGQVQEILARCGNKIEMFVIREDLLAPRKGKEPPVVKAVVHNPYNSPLSLYSTENIAETLAKQTEVLTEGRVSPTDEEEEAPENLSFKQKSAVFQLLEEQAKQDTNTSQYQSRGAPIKKSPAPPPPKPKPPSPVQQYQNKENYWPQESQQTVTYTTTTQQQSQGYRPAYASQDHYSHHQIIANNVDHHQERKEIQQPKRTVTFQSHSQQQDYQRNIQKAPAPPAPPTRTVQQTTQQNNMASAYSDHHDQSQYYVQQHQQQRTTPQQYYQPQYDKNYQSRPEWPPQHQHPQSQVTHQQPEQPYIKQRTVVSHPQRPAEPQPQQQREAIYDEVEEPVGTPITYKAPPSQKYKVQWPPTSPDAQQNGGLSSPSPTPASPTRSHNIDGIWPPRKPTVRDLPKTGFNPAAIREQGDSSGRRCVWPPPKSDDSGRTTPQSPVSGRRITWNPSPSPPVNRKVPFGFPPTGSPVSRRKDIAWPPPQAPTQSKDMYQQRTSSNFTRRARFDDYIRQHAGNNVPCTYRPPPGTQRVEYC